VLKEVLVHKDLGVLKVHKGLLGQRAILVPKDQEDHKETRVLKGLKEHKVRLVLEDPKEILDFKELKELRELRV